MPTSNLFEIDPDKLFEQCSIEEIGSTQIKLQHEIERKREELRTMVGERYRDLIEAADKITEMKEISQNVIKDVESVSAATDKLQQKNVKHFGRMMKQKDSIYSQVNVKIPSLEYVAIQLKLLVELPEHIWTALDNSDYATATQLYMLGRHIKTGLEMDPFVRASNSSIYGSGCPLLERQWVALSQFKDYILKSLGVALQEQTIDPLSACGCFISVALLENKCSKELVEYFLSLRTKALQKMIVCGQAIEDTVAIKSRFISSHTIIISTMMTLYSCFVESPGDGGDGILWRRIRKIIGRDSVPVINLINSNGQTEKENNLDGQYPYHLLPSIISSYRCCPECTLEPLPPSDMSSIISEWLANVTLLVTKLGKALLDKLSSLRSLQGLRDANQELPEEWSSVLQRLMQPSSMNIWNDLYMPLVTDRAKQLITVHWQAALKHIKQQTTSTLKEMATDNGCKTPENDLHWYIWKESPNDLTASVHQSQHKQPVRGVWLKSQGITPPVAELCNTFETQLSTLLNDLSTLYPSDNISIEKDEDSKALQSHQQMQCLDVLSQLVNFVKTEVDRSKDDIVPLLLARFLQTITKLCPTLQKCLTTADSKVNAWQEACNILTTEINHCWSVWRTCVLAALNDTITSVLLPPKQLKDLLDMIPQWDLVSIEEVGEAGQTISSELRVPSSPSFQLLSVLSSVCTTVSNALVPTYVTELLINELIIEILKIYQNRIFSEATVVYSSQLWQQLFDIKYITTLLVQHDNKSLSSQCHDLISLLEKNIDPFDLDVFTPYINDNIRRCQNQTQSILGVLVASRISTSFPATSKGTVSQSVSHNEDPSVLAVSSSASSTWFPLLPVTAPPGTRAINPTKVKVSKGGVTEQVQQEIHQPTVLSSKATSGVTSTATSFFGSMTSDWFG